MSDHNELAVQQVLEKEIRAMERRIKQLERQRAQGEAYAGEPITLHLPYRPLAEAQVPSPPSPSEPPIELRRQWLDTFLANCDQFGLFLHPTRFWHAALDEQSGLSPFLRFCAYLCGAAVARATNLAILLFKALQRRSTTMGAGSSTSVLESIQAEILLSRYFLYANKPLEAAYHSSTAGAMVSLARLPYLGSELRNNTTIHTHDGERIRGLWRTIEIEELLAIESRGLAGISGRTNEIDNLNTPFPRPIGEYEVGTVRHTQSQYTAREFKQSQNLVVPGQECDETLSSKVMLLWYWAHRNAHDRRQQAANQQDSYQWFRHLASQIDSFTSSLPNPSPNMPNILVHTRIRAAVISLHRDNCTVSRESHGKCIQASLEIFRLATLIPASIQFLEASFAVAWWMATECLVNFFVDWNPQTLSNLRMALARMLAFESTCPQMKYKLGKIKSVLSSPLQL